MHAQRLCPDGLVVGTAGNISLRRGDLVAITPSSFDYERLRPELVCVIQTDGRIVEAPLPPSSEVPMHLAVYERTTAGAVVHTHSPHATALSTLINELPPIHYLLAELGGPVRVARYATFGSAALAEAVARALEGRAAALLQNHGTITVGDSLAQAYGRALLLEWLAGVYYRARLLGEPSLLPPEEIGRVAEKLRSMRAEPRLTA